MAKDGKLTNKDLKKLDKIANSDGNFTNTESEHNQQEIVNLIRQGRKIEAIKLVRELTGMGLKDAKDYVEALE